MEYIGGVHSNARIHGNISGAAAGEVASVFAQQWPFNKAPVKVGSTTLTAATTTYSFTVKPALYTKYAVRVFADSTSTTPLGTSVVQNLYILPNGSVNNAQPCARPVCHETFRAYSNVPPSTLNTEMAKHVYPYFGIFLSPTQEPPPPNFLYLNAGHASVAPVRKINSFTFLRTISYSFTIGNNGYFWLWTACTKDTVYADGLGLPISPTRAALPRSPGRSSTSVRPRDPNLAHQVADLAAGHAARSATPDSRRSTSDSSL